jgi:hypothetical protein
VLAAKFGPAAGQSAIQLTPEQQAELSAATRGVLGMMHFADHQSPILLEALGDLLLTGQMEKNATQLAARAYLRAAQVTADPAVAARLRKMSEEAIASHIDFEEKGPGGREPKDLEAELAKEVAFGSAWFAAIESNEQRWIAEGRDVDREFAALYYDSLSKTVAAAERQLQSEPKDNRPSQNHQQVIGLVGAGAVCLGLPLVAIIVICGGIVWWRRRASHLHFPKGKQLPS